MKPQSARIGTDNLKGAESLPLTKDCAADIRAIISQARQSVVRNVNSAMVLAYWLIGRRIVVEEQKGKRAAYGERLLQRLSRELTADFGKGFAEPQLRNCRLFYQAYPSEEAIRYTLCIKLSWSHHRVIMRVGDAKAREFYLQEASERNLSVRDIVREIGNHAYERVRAHQIPTEQPENETNAQVTPNQILRDPVVAMAECKQMFVTKLLPSMPTKAELQFEIERARKAVSPWTWSLPHRRVERSDGGYAIEAIDIRFAIPLCQIKRS